MLFYQLYNWLRFKTLLPSTIFKNRLFIERDLRLRKIQNNLGWLIKTPNWLIYNKPIISIKYIYNFITYLFYVLTFILLVYLILNIKNFIFIMVFYNSLITYSWLTFENIFYYITYIIWLVSNVVLYLFQKYSYINKINLGDNVITLKNKNCYLLNIKTNLTLNNQNYVVSNWLLKSNVFKNSINVPNTYLNTIHNLYSITQLLKFTNNININSYINLNFVNDKTNLNLVSNNKLAMKNTSLFNLDTFTINNTIKAKLLNNVYLVYLNNTNINSIFKNINNLYSNELLNYKTSYKTTRWFYKYSTLHKQTFNTFKNINLYLNLNNINNINNQLDTNLWFNEYFKTTTTDKVYHNFLNTQLNTNLKWVNKSYLFIFNRIKILNNSSQLYYMFNIQPTSLHTETLNKLNYTNNKKFYLRSVWYNNTVTNFNNTNFNNLKLTLLFKKSYLFNNTVLENTNKLLSTENINVTRITINNLKNLKKVINTGLPKKFETKYTTFKYKLFI